MFDRLLKAFSLHDKKSKSQPLLRFAVPKSHDDNRTARNRLRKRIEPVPTPVPSPALERSQDDSIHASYQTRHWPSVDIERHGKERHPRGDSSLVDALRGRSRFSPPPRTRAPTPHPSASKPHNLKREKTVRWGSPLEIRLGTPAEEEGKTKIERDDLTTPTKEPATRTTPSDGNTPNGHSGIKEEEVRVSANEARPLQPLRRNRRSSIPGPKRQVLIQDPSKPTAFVADIQERPLDPLVPQAMPAPLRISTKRQSRAQPMLSSVSVPVITAKPKDKSTSTYSPQKKESTTTVPNYSRPTISFRDYSFEMKPEVLAIGSHSSHQRHIATKTDNKSVLPKPNPYLKCEPRRPGLANAVLPQTATVVKPTVSLAKCSTTPSFQGAEGFQDDVDGKDNDNSDASNSMPQQCTTPFAKSSPRGVPSKASSSSGVSYHTAKTHLAPINVGDLTTSTTASVATSSSMQAGYTPSIQSQLWNDLMEFCTPDRDSKSKLSSCAPYCACDDCLWRNESEVDLSSTVDRLGRR